VRNNQRRSRARRKAYVAELEEKLRRYESSGSQGVIDEDMTVKLLIEENETLKTLLVSLGLGNEFISKYKHASGMAQDMLKTVAQPDLQSELDHTNCCRTEQCSAPATELVSLFLNFYVPTINPTYVDTEQLHTPPGRGKSGAKSVRSILET
jgi:hypothetical protein